MYNRKQLKMIKCSNCDYECMTVKGMRVHLSRWCEEYRLLRLAAAEPRSSSPDAKRSRVEEESDDEGVSEEKGGDTSSDEDGEVPTAVVYDYPSQEAPPPETPDVDRVLELDAGENFYLRAVYHYQSVKGA